VRGVSTYNEEWGAGRGGEPTLGGTYDMASTNVGTYTSH
jgi:hypothetical protein